MSTNPRIYLDFNATAPLVAAAREAMVAALADTGNASSIHAEGRAVRDRIERARNQVADLLGRPREQIVFTSGGTEANALGVRTLALAAAERGLPRVVATSSIEHPSLLAALRSLGWAIRMLDVSRDGRITGDLAGVGLLAAAAVNHELGTILDPSLIASARAAGALVHIDAVQAAGKLSLPTLDADAIAISAHKIGGPQGAGAVALAIEPRSDHEAATGASRSDHETATEASRAAIDRDTAGGASAAVERDVAAGSRAGERDTAGGSRAGERDTAAGSRAGERDTAGGSRAGERDTAGGSLAGERVIVGGHQERGRRGGTENAVGIVGFGAAAAAVDLATWPAVAALGERLEAGLLAIEGTRIHGAAQTASAAGAVRTGGTINAGFAGARGEAIVIALDLAGIAVSTGAACTSGTLQPSPVLLGLGYSPEEAREAVRFSLGRPTTSAEIDRVIAVLPDIVARARRYRS